MWSESSRRSAAQCRRNRGSDGHFFIAYFVHLKFERFSLFLTLFPMLIFCILMMMVFMPDSMRLVLMRTQ